MGDRQRLRYRIQGTVQGVGFRPFVYHLARQNGLAGWVSNTSAGAELEVEGDHRALMEFDGRLESDKPAHCFYAGLERLELPVEGASDFSIRNSLDSGPRRALILPDLATCPECLREIFDTRNPRYRYPFTNCTHCGPRYSIIEAVPYDRYNTTMRGFPLCLRCFEEYHDPRDRRFHAQPVACPDCGPQLAWWSPQGTALCKSEDALQAALQALRDGRIVAMKGLGGFQLLADARRQDAVELLRARKHREAKPFAVMMPCLDAAERWCSISPAERDLLTSPAAPIVLLAHRAEALIAPAVAPHNPYLGVMLPYTPLHHLLMAGLGFPIVATSGNLGEEPILIDEIEAVQKLGPIADGFLVHDRPIARPVDDSVVRLIAGKPTVLRRARGYVPLPVRVNHDLPPSLAVGGQMKNTVAIASGREVFLSQYIGDLTNTASYERFTATIGDLQRLHQITPEHVICDLHPDYLSTRYAESSGLPRESVQHHLAHVLSVIAEHGIREPVLGISWDGTGFGPDHTIWGGEFLLVNGAACHRIAHLRPFPLPGGDHAVRDPQRVAQGLLYALRGPAQSDAPQPILRMLATGFNSPLTSSAGRLFDAVASLLQLATCNSFEGQAAMQLEFAIEDDPEARHYPFPLTGDQLDWGPLIEALLAERDSGVPSGILATRFHRTLVEAILAVARHAAIPRVALTGGCFQNKWLAEHTIERLREEGFSVYWQQQVPPNDGGLALGQIWSTSGPRS
ncbi:MAG: carbamoyltransferase HypF [Acidobacteria bacterium]|nr:carbamoyltransferase HypF [Acidobacteriota bacterium]